MVSAIGPQLLAGKYLLHVEIGRGGAGIVLSAVHATLQTRVAIKLPRAADDGAAARLLHEARIGAALRGPHVARVLDAGTLDSGVPFLVLEHLEGRDLADEVAARGALPVAEAVEYLLQACEGLAEAHALGVVHRDIKPANLFLARSAGGAKTLKLLDFGIAKRLDGEGSAERERDDLLLGSPHFMPPEQYRSAWAADARSDIWALGTVLFTMLAGRLPFEGTRVPEVLGAILCGKLPSFRSLGVDVPDALGEVVARCLRASPDARFASVAELARALLPFASAAPVEARARVERIERVLRGDAPCDLPDGGDPKKMSPRSAGGVLPLRGDGQTLCTSAP